MQPLRALRVAFLVVALVLATVAFGAVSPASAHGSGCEGLRGEIACSGAFFRLLWL